MLTSYLFRCASLSSLGLLAAALPVTAGAGTAPLEAGDIIVTDSIANHVLRIDPVSGDREVISSNTHPDEMPYFADPLFVTAQSTVGVVVSDTSLNVLYLIDPSTGERTVHTDQVLANGAQGLQAASLGTLFCDATADAVKRVNAGNGLTVTLSGAGVGSGPVFVRPFDVVQQSEADLLVMDFGTGNTSGRLFHVDTESGDRVVLSDNLEHGFGEDFDGASFIALEPAAGLETLPTRVLVSNQAGDQILRVDTVTGERTLVSSNDHGSGPEFTFPLDIAIEHSGAILVLDQTKGVLRVDPDTGDRTVVSSSYLGIERGSGPLLSGGVSGLDVIPVVVFLSGFGNGDFLGWSTTVVP